MAKVKPTAPIEVAALDVPESGIFWQDIDALKVWGVDDKTHGENYNEGDVGLIAEGIRQYGFAGVAKVWKDNQLRGGNHTVMAVRSIKQQGRQPEDKIWPPKNIAVRDGKWFVPCVSVAHLSETEAIGFAIFDNRAAAKASQNDEFLFEYLSNLRESEDDLITGYDDDDYALLAKLMHEPVTMEPLTNGVEASFDTFMNASSIKQIVLYMDTTKFISTVERLSRVMTENGLENNTEVVLFLLDQYEAVHPQVREDEDDAD